MAFSFEWTELQDALEAIAPTEAQRAKVAPTIEALQREAATLSHQQALRQICTGIWLTMADEGPDIIETLEAVLKGSPPMH